MRLGRYLLVLCLLAAPAFAQIVTGPLSAPGIGGTGALSGGGGLSSYDAALSSDTPVAFWKMNDPVGCSTLVDALGANNATAGAGITCGAATLVTGDPETSATFNGTTSTCAGVTGSALTFDRGQAFWVSAVISPNVTRSGGFAGYSLIAKSSLTSPFPGMDLSLIYNNSGSDTNLIVEFDEVNTFPTNWLSAYTTANITNAVHSLFFFYDGSSTVAGVKIFIDGVSQAITNNGDTLSASILNSGPAQIGCRDTQRPFNGTIQKLAIGYGYPTGAGASNLFVSEEAARLASLALAHAAPAAWGAVPNILLVNDLGDDIDNAAELLLIERLVKNGQATLAGVVSCDNISASVTAYRAFLNFYSLGSTPLYRYTGTGLPTSDIYAGLIATKFNGADSPSNYGDATAGIRTILHNATSPITIVDSGPQTCTDNALESAADGIDSRTGKQLIAAKVNAAIFNAGYAPSNGYWSQAAEFNIAFSATTIASAQDLVANWPSTVPIVQFGVEGIQPFASNAGVPATGPPTIAPSATNPFQDAFNDASATLSGGKRPAWGDSAMYLALLGIGGMNGVYQIGGIAGTEAVDGSGNNSWTVPASFWSFAHFQGSVASLSTAMQNIEYAAPWP